MTQLHMTRKTAENCEICKYEDMNWKDQWPSNKTANGYPFISSYIHILINIAVSSVTYWKSAIHSPLITSISPADSPPAHHAAEMWAWRTYHPPSNVEINGDLLISQSIGQHRGQHNNEGSSQ